MARVGRVRSARQSEPERPLYASGSPRAVWKQSTSLYHTGRATKRRFSSILSSTPYRQTAEAVNPVRVAIWHGAKDRL